MKEIDKKVAALFKKAYFYNWDDGLAGLRKILQDKHCDLATAKLIFWFGVPGYYYNHATPSKMRPYELEAFQFLQELAQSILAGKFPALISYALEDATIPADLGNIPPSMAEPVMGIIGYQAILYPNSNPFQDQILALCNHCGSVDEMEALARLGADFSLKIINGNAFPLQVAINHGQVEAVRYLVDHGFDVHAMVNKSPLFFGAVTNGHPEMVAYLLDQGVKPNQKDGQGMTALHYLSYFTTPDGGLKEKHEAAVKVLLARGADKHALNKQKLSPIEMARKDGKLLYAQFLESN